MNTLLPWIVVSMMLSHAPDSSFAGASMDDPRIAEIWGHANFRMGQQEDAWFEDGEFPRVVQLLAFRRELYPTNYEIVTNLGWMYKNVGREDREIEVYQRFREQATDYPDAALPEIQFHAMKRQWAEIPAIAEPRMRFGNRLHPNNFRLLARAYEELGRLEDSLRIWDMYLGFAPDDGAAIANRTRVYEKLTTG